MTTKDFIGNTLLSRVITISAAQVNKPIALREAPEAANQGAMYKVQIKAYSTNTGIVYVGSRGAPAWPLRNVNGGQEITIDISRLSQVFVQGDTAGDKVAYVAVAYSCD